MTNVLGQITSSRFNSCSSTVGSTSDPDNQPTTPSYDTMGRVLASSQTTDGQTLRVCYTNLGNALRPGFTLQTFGGINGLFPLLDGSSATLNDGRVISTIWLPDGRNYKLSYNSYGELARVDLPTGGAYEYDYGAALANGDATGVVYVATYFGDLLENAPEIYRRVFTRRVFSSAGILEGQTTFSQTTAQGTPTSTVSVQHLDPGGAVVLAREDHYFFGDPIPSNARDPLYNYPGWKESREYRTEEGTPALRRAGHTWQQRAPVSW